MARWSFGLRQLFLWTAAIALGLVALRSASATWAALMLALAVAALTVSILLVIFRRGPQRAYWIGFATCGWMYLLLVLLSWTLGQSTTSNDSPLRARNLVTQRLSRGVYHWLYDKAFEQYNANVRVGSAGGMYGMDGGYGDMYSGPPYDSGAMAGDSGMMPSDLPVMPGGRGGRGGPAPPPAPPAGPNVTDFVNVAHALWTLLLATLGGCLAWWLYMTGPGRTERQAPASLTAR